MKPIAKFGFFLLALTLVVAGLGISSRPAQASANPSSTVPVFYIISVARDNSVTIQTYNFPANDSFNVLMGPYGTQGVGGYHAGTYNSGNGASKTVTYSIPAALYGSNKIAIRLQSNTGSGYFSYNWFYNNTAGSSGGKPGYSGYPTIKILSVVRDNKVTFRAYNLPKNYNFKVLMGPYGTKAVGGYVVGNFNSGAGGTQDFVYPIPSQLYGAKKIAIRIQTNPFFAYNWFWNNTTN
jgi:hypothetical protein